jgi:catechol 2,3-dioxygenase-like lactoylglutathione lyase family enzyme
MRFAANNELALHVPDPAAAAEFYTRVLGCRLVAREDVMVTLESGALRLYLLRDPTLRHRAPIPSYDVADREAERARLIAAGCRTVPIGPHAPEGEYFVDPFGFVFDIVERPERGHGPVAP